MEPVPSLKVRPLALACLAVLAVAAVAGAASRPLDLDGDGLSAQEEHALGSSPVDSDSDDDGLADGWEARRGLGTTFSDSDLDGLGDDVEVEFGSDPLAKDSDGDGLSDLAENPAGDGGPDCDGDGARAASESDDDGDERPDAAEASDLRCDPDADDDGVLDGREANAVCITSADCEGDGVRDADESPAGFDPLDPDTFDVHLPDGVSYAFAKNGQAPGRDGDVDGIPDSWENQTGLIDWGPFRPQAGQRDLFVEFVRVVGPDSERYGDLSLTPAYDRVVQAFSGQDIRLQYVETRVRLTPEPIAASNPSRTTTHYRSVLDGAKHSANPYVLTVVLNPQHNQSQIVHAGVAPLRGMLAAIDVSQFVQFWYDSSDGNYTSVGPFSPFLESIIASGRVLQDSDAGKNADGTYYKYVYGAGGISREVRWTPYWFRSPQIRHSNNQLVPLLVDRLVLEDAPLAHTVLHEIGHTLGLCHPHEPDCLAQLPASEQSRAAESSMSYTSPDTLVAYLPSEWTRVKAYLACPPPTPIRLVAEGGTRDALLDAKYAYEFDPDPATAGRNCEDYEPLLRQFDAVVETTTYRPPAERKDPPAPNEESAPALAYWTGVMATAAFAGLSVYRWRQRADARPLP